MLTDLNKFNKFIKARNAFSVKTFGSPLVRGPQYPLRHLRREVTELLRKIDDPLEWADCFLLLLDSAFRAGLTVDDLVNFANRKLKINRKRKWLQQKDGTYRHIEYVQVPKTKNKQKTKARNPRH